MADDLRAVLAGLVESWRDDAWDYQRRGRPELRDLTYRHADQLAELLEQITDRGSTDG